MSENLITLELIDIVWPKHDRTSCSDDNLSNADPHYENGAPRCSRCMALDNLHEPSCNFVIEASIRSKQDPAVIRERALKKLTHAEKQALGLT